MDRRALDLSPLALHHRLVAVEEHAAVMLAWKESVDENTLVQREMINVGKDIISALRVLRWVGTAVKWLAKVAAYVGILWASVKGFPTHLFWGK